jgi:NAD(P)-dependent dehydrogenase (short-subunit alcohol dehydrogenase family)
VAHVRVVEMDVSRQDSIDAAVGTVIERDSRIDVVIHNAGHMVYVPSEAFTPEQLAELYDVNVPRNGRSTTAGCSSNGWGSTWWLPSRGTSQIIAHARRSTVSFASPRFHC